MTNPDLVQQVATVSSDLVHLDQWSVIKVSGEKAEEFLQGQITCDVTQLADTKSNLAALCNHQGRIIGVFFITRRASDFLLLLPTSVAEPFRLHLQKFAVFSKVCVENVTASYFIYAVIGDQAIAGMQEIYPNLPLDPWSCALQQNIQFCRLPSSTPCLLAWGQLEPIDAMQTKFTVNSDQTAWQKYLVNAALPFIYFPTMAMMTPHMLDLDQLNAVSFQKGCYVGQEIIARTHYLGKSKRHLYRARMQGDYSLQPGTVLTVAGLEVGVVVDTVVLGQEVILLAVLQDSSIEQEIRCEGRLIDTVVRCRP